MRFSRILVPTDFSASADEAAAVAGALAATAGGTVTLLYVYNPPSLMLPDGSTFVVTPSELVQESERAEADVARAKQALAGTLDPKVHVAAATAMGVPAQEIQRMAASGDFDIVVMGTHGRTGLRRVLLGSVAEQVLRHASIPVLTVREHAVAAGRAAEATSGSQAP
ncbi:MAG TPA: universal stress protein [Polyangia bacterium]|jgi:nucleotide-binding universal stress UspA family protein|nr:universal stress protein [Polyangia bacterium]